MRYHRILHAVAGTPWAIHPEKGKAIIDFLVSQAENPSPSHAIEDDTVQHRAELTKEPVQVERRQAIAVLPISSVILPRAHDVKDSSLGPSGGQSAERLEKQFSALVSDTDISAIVLDIDSPGGAVGGVPELFEIISAASEQKHVVAVANHFCASAAYWIACAASEIVMTPSAMIGSVGVYTYHEDISQALEHEGVKPTYISSSAEKIEGSSQFALSDGARSHMQATVDTYAAHFVRDVARGRGVSELEVRQTFGNGRMHQADYAKAHGMVDRIATLDQVLFDLKSSLEEMQNENNMRRRRLALA
ncbi:MAG: S49 family peptidase [Pseudomonadota bacterium]